MFCGKCGHNIGMVKNFCPECGAKIIVSNSGYMPSKIDTKNSSNVTEIPIDTTVKGTIRTIFDLKVEEEDKIIKISVTGDGFLYNMVRIIVGTLIEVGRGKNKPEDIKEIILKKDRKLAGFCVPAKGLFLKEVYY